MFLTTLPASARQLLPKLGKLTSLKKFYLAGGSATALQLGHRVSVDFDFFQREAFDANRLRAQLQDCGQLSIQQQAENTFLGALDNVRISFFTLPYPLLERGPSRSRIRLASLRDLGAMKWIAVGQRGSKRDFVDLYYIVRNGLRLDELAAGIRTKYAGVSIPYYHLVRSLAYFDDADSQPDPEMLVPWSWDGIKRFFEKQARRLGKVSL